MDKPPINYQLVGIDILSKNMAPLITPIQEGAVFKFDLKVESKIDATKNQVIAVVEVNMIRQDTNEIAGSITTACFFLVLDFDKHIILNKDNLYELPGDLENAIRPISISTTRGVMFSEFKGSYLHNAVLPVIMMNALTPLKKQPEPKVE